MTTAEKISEIADEVLDSYLGTNFVEIRKARNAVNLARLIKANELGYVQSIRSEGDGRIVIQIRKPLEITRN